MTATTVSPTSREGMLIVQSATRDFPHIVEIIGPHELTCSCEAAAHGSPTCRHRQAVFTHLAEQVTSDAYATYYADVCPVCDCAGTGPLCRNHEREGL